MPYVRLAIFAFQNRGLLMRVLFWSVAIAVGLPLVLALLAVSVLAGVARPGALSGAARPMPTWVVTQPFGCTGLYFEPPLGSCPHFHSGIDLAAPAGTPVSAVIGGSVRVLPPAGIGGGYGLHVLVSDPNGVTTLYAHLAAVATSTGQSVSAGNVIGYEGSSGNSTGAHLHFEVRRADVALDPAVVFPELFATPAKQPVQPGPSTTPGPQPKGGQQ